LMSRGTVISEWLDKEGENARRRIGKEGGKRRKAADYRAKGESQDRKKRQALMKP